MLPAEFRLPALVARIGSQLPQQPWSFASWLAVSLARHGGYLPEDMGFLEGKSLCIELEDVGARATLAMRNGRFVPCFTEQATDLRLCATLASYVALLSRREDPDTLFFQRRLRIEGDTELGLELKNMLDSIEPPGWLMRILS